MRRADRLFRIVRILRGGRLQTARMLAQKLEVSERTIYRDVSDLQASGMPIEGEAGVGYTLRRDLDLPPLMFTRDELTALVLGARLVRVWSGVWTMTAWCELRKDFRTFRIDRMQDVRVVGREFVQKKGQRLEDYLRQATRQNPVETLPKHS